MFLKVAASALVICGLIAGTASGGSGYEEPLSVFETQPRYAQMGLQSHERSVPAVKVTGAARCLSWKNIAGGKLVCFRSTEPTPARVVKANSTRWNLEVAGNLVALDPRRQVLPLSGSKVVVVPGGIARDPSLGSKSSHSFIFEDDDGVARWNRCAPVRWVADMSQLGGSGLVKANELARMGEVLALVSKASGVKFEFVGEGVVRNGRDGETFELDPQTRALKPNLVITYGTGTGKGRYVFKDIAGSTAGVGGVYVEKYPGKTMRITDGFAIFDVEALAELDGAANKWRTPSDFVGSVYVHEILHAMNLAHVSDETQTMNPAVTHGIARIARGDREALTLTKTLPCLK